MNKHEQFNEGIKCQTMHVRIEIQNSLNADKSKIKKKTKKLI